MTFMSFSHQLFKRLMIMKLCHSNSGLKMKNSQILPALNYQRTKYIDELCSQLDKFQFHHFVLKAQAASLHNLKDCLKNNKCIVLQDFDENYSYFVQDAVQGFHWNNSQVTLNPFVAYYKKQNHLNSFSYCVLWDYLHHNANVACAFVYHILQSLKILLLQVPHVHYFSDGAPSQYKSFKNLANLIHRQDDHQLSAKWHFFAKSPVKSSCNGIGGTVKCLVTHSSFQNRAYSRK